MSFKVEFSGQRRGAVKTKVTDLQDTDGHPVYLLTPGSEGSESLARQKWQRFTDWLIDGAIDEGTVVTPLQAKLPIGPSFAVRAFVLVAVAFAGAIVGSAATMIYLNGGWPW